MDTSPSKSNMNNLLLLCTKNVLFCFDGDIYQKSDGVAIGSFLGSVLAGTFVVELETGIMSTVTDSISHWKRYVDDTFIFIRKSCAEHDLANSFHKNI